MLKLVTLLLLGVVIVNAYDSDSYKKYGRWVSKYGLGKYGRIISGKHGGYLGESKWGYSSGARPGVSVGGGLVSSGISGSGGRFRVAGIAKGRKLGKLVSGLSTTEHWRSAH